MGLQKGRTNNKAGRPAGTPNKLTGALKETFASVISDNLERLEAMKDEMSIKELIDYTKSLVPYVVPRQNDISFNDPTEKLPIINITVSEPVNDDL
jgi:hypothetical protein